MSKKRKAILDRVAQQFGLEDDRTIFIHQLAEEYEDTDWNNNCLHMLVDSLIALIKYED